MKAADMKQFWVPASRKRLPMWKVRGRLTHVCQPGRYSVANGKGHSISNQNDRGECVAAHLLEAVNKVIDAQRTPAAAWPLAV